MLIGREKEQKMTADERLLNAKLDAIRFLGEPAPAVPGLMILLR